MARKVRYSMKQTASTSPCPRQAEIPPVYCSTPIPLDQDCSSPKATARRITKRAQDVESTLRDAENHLFSSKPDALHTRAYHLSANSTLRLNCPALHQEHASSQFPSGPINDLADDRTSPAADFRFECPRERAEDLLLRVRQGFPRRRKGLQQIPARSISGQTPNSHDALESLCAIELRSLPSGLGNLGRVARAVQVRKGRPRRFAKASENWRRAFYSGQACRRGHLQFSSPRIYRAATERSRHLARAFPFRRACFVTTEGGRPEIPELVTPTSATNRVRHERWRLPRMAAEEMKGQCAARDQMSRPSEAQRFGYKGCPRRNSRIDRASLASTSDSIHSSRIWRSSLRRFDAALKRESSRDSSAICEQVAK